MESMENITNDLRNSENPNFESQTEIKKQKFQIVNQVGIIYAIGIAFLSQVANVYFFLFTKFFPNFSKTNKSDTLLLGTLIVNQIFGSLLMFILTKFIKKLTIKKYIYGCKKFVINLFINSGLLYFGSLIGYIIQILFAKLFISKNQTKDIVKEVLTKNSNIFLQILVICITAPIAEEFIYRKLLIDRLAIFSKSLAIFSSGIMFGIFHNNIHQFFGAMILGWALAYAYVETGNLIIPIIYHMLENSLTTLLALTIPEKINDSRINTKIYNVIYLFRLIGASAGIILLIAYRKKIKVTGEDNRSNDKWKFFKSYGMWIFIFEGFLLFFILHIGELLI